MGKKKNGIENKRGKTLYDLYSEYVMTERTRPISIVSASMAIPYSFPLVYTNTSPSEDSKSMGDNEYKEFLRWKKMRESREREQSKGCSGAERLIDFEDEKENKDETEKIG